MTTPTTEARPRDRRATGSLTALLTAHAISQTGNVVTAFAIPFYVLGLGGSGVEVGVAAFFATAPVVIGGALGGVVVDRVGHRRAAIVADLVSGATVLTIPVLALTVGLPFWALLLLVFAGGLLDTPGQTARRVMLPSLTARAGVRLEQSVGLLDGSERFARLIGASIAGLLVALVGPMAALFVNAATFAVSALLTWAFVAVLPADSAQTTAVDRSDAPRTSYWADLAEGFQFVIHDPLMRLIVGLVLITNLFDAARGATLLPLYANDRLGGAAVLGLLVAVMGGCALIGNVVFGFVAHRVPRRLTFAACFALAGGPSSAAFALGAPLPVLVAMTALSGLAAGAINPILGTVELERVPPHMRGRVFGMINAGAWAGVPFGALLGGIAADTIGLAASFGIIAVAYTLVTLSPLTGGAWRQMERQPAPTTDT
ncbi:MULTISPECIES: MFS transporter [unclassified Cryobacterium]|uniref:MFS transporter n=1 Tax=unclassified Cryobacterium TaxID=2649013 RepID=UPI00106D7430|nr:MULTISPECIES: MFS transporter [unclassified Cryobacterium]TFC50362.1 MFS transporter [Cryobacterium sp. TMB3-1-2]TFC71903.1 MFS transporter [Cryobacterium sp. TMB3-15]TFC78496.1 MFS transporter [Cryobacterium sp. TMB3-10]TFD44553.1 MFS transporter [Cryobacterium sp. TMB3-12]